MYMNNDHINLVILSWVKSTLIYLLPRVLFWTLVLSIHLWVKMPYLFHFCWLAYAPSCSVRYKHTEPYTSLLDLHGILISYQISGCWHNFTRWKPLRFFSCNALCEHSVQQNTCWTEWMPVLGKTSSICFLRWSDISWSYLVKLMFSCIFSYLF